MGKMLPKTELFGVLAAPCYRGDCSNVVHAWQDQRRLLQKYSLHTVDYFGEVVLKNGWRFFGPGPHAHGPVHQLVADLISNSMGRALEEYACHAESARSEKLETQSSNIFKKVSELSDDDVGCRTPLVHYSAKQSF